MSSHHTIHHLHSDVIHGILSFLDGRSIILTRSSCKIFNECYMNHRERIWKELWRREFPSLSEKINYFIENRGDGEFTNIIEKKVANWSDYFDLFFNAKLHHERKGQYKLNILKSDKLEDKQESNPNDILTQTLPVSFCCFMKKYRNLEGYLPNENVLSRLTNEERGVLNIMTDKNRYLFFSRFNDPVFSLVDVKNNRIAKKFVGHKGTVLDIKCLFTDPFNLKSTNVGAGTFYLNTTSTSFNNRVVSASSDKTIKIWNFTTGSCIESLTEHKGSVVSIEMINENVLCSASHDLSIKLWDLNHGASLSTLDNVHEKLIYKIQYNSWNNFLASCGKDGTTNLFDMRTISNASKPFKTLDHIKDGDTEKLSVYSIAMNSHTLCCGGKDGLFTMYDLRNLEKPLLKKNFTSSIDRIYSDEFKAVLFEGFTCKVLDLNTMQEETITELENRQATYCVALGNEPFIDYNTMVTQIDNQNLCLVDML
ncbi:WD40 domain-containing protein [Naegleria gruberi]|uniref:WD40 domain-containing protein n=1 Tax=Naegleria gruberi TaxID=5762 RepID=D2VNV9_NAEGR|nr:WD40 domain-containing protein [Naegleria gruberi]EFC41487.1 WD40 domain-containing protein [Naegleria gruberi]|eukprot:XP_002674231.1 WD40 domain-containing protein [Naegleria gruberi strain NEG-M]